MCPKEEINTLGGRPGRKNQKVVYPRISREGQESVRKKSPKINEEEEDGANLSDIGADATDDTLAAAADHVQRRNPFVFWHKKLC